MPIHAILNDDGVVESSPDFFSAINTSPVVMKKCMPIRIQPDGTLKRARAFGDYETVRKIGGLCWDDSVEINDPARVQISGYFHATTEQWDFVTLETGGLTPGGLYYLSGDFGQITQTIPSTASYTDPWVIEVGTAISSTELIVRFVAHIKQLS